MASENSIEVTVPVAEQRDKIRCFYAFLEGRQQVRAEVIADVARRIPALTELANDASVLQAHESAVIGLERAAVHEDRWEPLVRYMREQGRAYARLGLSMPDVLQLTSAFRDRIQVEVLDHFADDPSTLRDALSGMNALIDFWNGTLGTAFFVEREHRLRHTELRATATIAGAIDAIFIVDQDGMIVRTNPAAQILFGYDANEAVGRDLVELIIPREDRAGFRTTLELSLSDAAPARQRIEQRALRADGRVFPVEIGIARIGDDHPPEAATFIRDLTIQRAIEERARASQRMEALGRFAGGVAHDFNNLLVVISISVDEALARSEQSRRDEDLLAIREATKRARELTGQLLTFSRQQPQQQATVSVNRVIRASLDLLHPILGEQIELRLDLDRRAGWVEIDPSQFDQVVVNLVLNARDAMPGGGRLTLRTRAVTLGEGDEQWRPADCAPGRYVQIVVEDNGIGMDEETQSRAAEPFFSTKPVGQGTGLGLATVHGIVRQSRGFMAIDSKLGRGTRFEIHFPRAEAAARPADADVDERPRGSESVLVVEDYEIVRRSISRPLRTHGYHVLEAANAAEALEIAADPSTVIDLLLSDVVMPGMSGVELAEELERLRPGLRTLFVSGHLRRDMADDVRRMPLLTKPFTISDLLVAARRVLDDPTR